MSFDDSSGEKNIKQTWSAKSHGVKRPEDFLEKKIFQADTRKIKNLLNF